MESWLSEDLNLPTAGEVRHGWVVESHGNEILVDIRAKSEGIIPGAEVAELSPEMLEVLQVGNEVAVFVVNPEDRDGNLILSYSRAVEQEDWARAEELLESREVFEGTISGYNKGGVIVNLGQLRGFVPNSQLSRSRLAGKEGDARREALEQLMGETVHTRVLEVDQEQNRLILSEKAAGKAARDARRAELLDNYEEGEVYTGRVVSLTRFGAFVDVGGVEGLVHLSELSWKRIDDPAELLNVGDDVEVKVIRIDKERQRIALSIKRLQPDPWTLVEELYEVGQLVEAEITRLTKFGAFARLNDEYGLEGLIHVSELAEERVEHPQEVVEVSDTVTVRIIRIDSEQRQLGLSLSQVKSEQFIASDLEALASM